MEESILKGTEEENVRTYLEDLQKKDPRDMKSPIMRSPVLSQNITVVIGSAFLIWDWALGHPLLQIMPDGRITAI